MLKVIGWVLGNLPLLIGAVTTAVAVVEAMKELINEPGPEKKKRVLAILRENVPRYIPVPEFIQRHLDAILGILIDLVVFILNHTRGRDWGQKIEAAVTVQAVATAATPPSPAPSTSDARLDELEAKLRR